MFLYSYAVHRSIIAKTKPVVPPGQNIGQLRSWYLGDRRLSPVSKAALVAKGKGATDEDGLGATVDTAQEDSVMAPIRQDIFGGSSFAYCTA